MAIKSSPSIDCYRMGGVPNINPTGLGFRVPNSGLDNAKGTCRSPVSTNLVLCRTATPHDLPVSGIIDT